MSTDTRTGPDAEVRVSRAAEAECGTGPEANGVTAPTPPPPGSGQQWTMSHGERAVRRREIAAEVAAGRDPADIARERGVGIELVRNACKMHGVPWRRAARPSKGDRLNTPAAGVVSHEARAARRAEMARAVLAGATMAEVAAAFGVTDGTVSKACGEMEISPQSLRIARQSERVRLMVDAVRSGTPVLEAADQAGVPRTRPVEMAAAVASGRLMVDVASEFNVNISTVYLACVRYGGHQPRARSAASAERRQRAVEAVLSGRSVVDVALETGLTAEGVRSACTEQGVRPPRARGGKPLSVNSFRILARLLNTSDGIGDIARTMGLTYDAVQQVLKRAAEAGVRFPHREANLPPGGRVWRETDTLQSRTQRGEAAPAAGAGRRRSGKAA